MREKRRWLWIDKDSSWYNCNYIGMFDFTKGLIMLGIISIHCVSEFVDYRLYALRLSDGMRLLISPLGVLQYGAVPMLFMICGYGMRKQPVKVCIKNNLSIFLPSYGITIFGVTAGVLLKWILNGGSLSGRLRQQVLPFFLGWHPGDRFFGDRLDQIGPVWFVLTYVLGSIYLNLVLHEKERWRQAIIIAVGTIAAMLTTEIPLPFCAQQVLICSGFMYMGMLLKQGKVLQKPLPIYIVLMGYLLCILGSECGGLVEFASNAFNLRGNDLGIAYVAGVVVLCICQRLNVIQGILADGVRWIGRHMLWFCCVHTITYVVVPWDHVVRCFGGHAVLGILVTTLASFLIALLGCAVVESMAKKLLSARLGTEGSR